MNSMNTTTLDGVFCWPCPLLSFSIFDELIAKKQINSSEKRGTEESLSYLAKRVFLKKRKLLIMFAKNQNLFQLVQCYIHPSQNSFMTEVPII